MAYSRGDVQGAEESEGNSIKVHAGMNRACQKAFQNNYPNSYLFFQIEEGGLEIRAFAPELRNTDKTHNMHVNAYTCKCTAVTWGEVWENVYYYHFTCKTFLQDILDF